MKVGDTCRYDITPHYENANFDVFFLIVGVKVGDIAECLLIGADTDKHYVSKPGVVVEVKLKDLRPMFKDDDQG